MPEAGIDRKIYRSHKFGSWAYSQQLDVKTVQATASDDVEFRYDLMEFTPNTLKAHRLTWLAGKSNRATEMAVRILKAYFSEGKNISSVDTLVALPEEIGLDGDIRAFLLSTEGMQEVRELEQQTASQGIRSVPTIWIGDNNVVAGAQSVEILVATLKNAIESLQ